MPQIVNTPLGGNTYVPPYLYAQGNGRRDRGWNDAGGFLQQIMQQQLAETNRRREMADALKMQTTLMGMRQAFQGEQAGLDRSFMRDQWEASRDDATRQFDLLEKRFNRETGLLQKQVDQVGAQTESLRTQTNLAKRQFEIESDAVERDKRAGKAASAVSQLDIVKEIKQGNHDTQITRMQTQLQDQADELAAYTRKMPEYFETYNKESGFGEILSSDAKEARDHLFKIANRINKGLSSNEPAKVAASRAAGEQFMEQLRQGGGGFWGWARGGSTIGGIASLVSGENVDTTKPNIWNDGPIKRLRSLMDDDKVFDKAMEFNRALSAIKVDAAQTNANVAGQKMGVLNAYSEYDNPVVDQLMQNYGLMPMGPPVPTGLAPKKMPPGYQQPVRVNQSVPGTLDGHDY